ADVLRPGGRHEAHGHRHQPEADRTRPDGLRHDELPLLPLLLPSQVVAPSSKKRPAAGAEPATHVEVDGRRLRLTNLHKVLYPGSGFTKGQVIDFYARVAPTMLPHLHDRPVTMVRLPDGVTGERFFEKRCPGHRPQWLGTVPLDADSEIFACSLDSVPALVWTANLAALE